MTDTAPIELAPARRPGAHGARRQARRAAGALHLPLALAIVLAVFAQVYLIGAYVFGGSGALDAQKSVGWSADTAEMALFVMALAAWLPRTDLAPSFALVAIGTAQVALAGSVKWVGGLHPLLALVVLGLAGDARASGDPPAGAPPAALPRAGGAIVLVVYRAAVDARPADWVIAGMRGFAASVLSLVPAGFPAYLRVFHPAYRTVAGERAPVTWAQVARANGTLMHAGAQLGAITGSERYEWEGQPGVFDQPPETGSIPPDLLAVLAGVLARHTRTPGACHFAVWEGVGTLPGDVRAAPVFAPVPQRRYHLLTGPVGGLGAPGAWAQATGTRSPNLWWPQDRAWCVATEVDLKTTYIGAARSCVRELAGVPAVEAATVPPDLGVDWLGDTLNPPPAP